MKSRTNRNKGARLRLCVFAILYNSIRKTLAIPCIDIFVRIAYNKDTVKNTDSPPGGKDNTMKIKLREYEIEFKAKNTKVTSRYSAADSIDFLKDFYDMMSLLEMETHDELIRKVAKQYKEDLYKAIAENERNI